MFCPKCGKELIPNTRFCTECGIDVPKAIDELNAKALRLETKKATPTESSTTTEHQGIAARKSRVNVFYLFLIFCGILCMVFILHMDLVQAIAWVVIGLLAWAFIKPYVVIGHMYENNYAGIRTNLTWNQIINLLEENPWCDDQLVREDDSEIPGSQHHAQIYFRGICSQVHLFIEDGVLHAHGSSAVLIEKFRRLYLVHKETQNLLLYITALEQGDAASAKRLKQKNSTTIKLRRWYDEFDQLCSFIGSTLQVRMR